MIASLNEKENEKFQHEPQVEITLRKLEDQGQVFKTKNISLLKICGRRVIK